LELFWPENSRNGGVAMNAGVQKLITGPALAVILAGGTRDTDSSATLR
jgi:hypothetical protein